MAKSKRRRTRRGPNQPAYQESSLPEAATETDVVLLEEDELPAPQKAVAPGEDEPLPLYEDEESEEEKEQRLREALGAVVNRLDRLALEQVQAKNEIEERWLLDLRQYHGRYDADTEKKLKESKRSKLFVGLTRTKTSSWESRLSDLLFPTDGQNWDIEPTPVPTISSEAQKAYKATQTAASEANAIMDQAEREQDPQRKADLLAKAEQIAVGGNEQASKNAELQDTIDAARQASDLMQDEIADQLVECSYSIRAREAIHDMCKLGTGIMKGPVASNRMRRQWTKSTPIGEDGEIPAGAPTAYALGMTIETRPEFSRVDPWNFFPEMSARTLEEASFTFERHLWNAGQLKRAVKSTGLDPKAVAELIEEKPKEAMPAYWTSLREITLNTGTAGVESRYHVWEYHGPLEKEDLETIATATGDEAIMKDYEENVLEDFNVIMWFCQGRLLKIGPHPMDSGETLYSAVPFERDDTSIFGYSVPALMRDSQDAMNAAWRMIMDNAGLSVGPQIVIDQSVITPVNGSYELTPMKQWLLNSSSLTKLPEGARPFQTFDIPSRQDHLESIIAHARQFADDETNMPLIAYGEQASHITQTAQGMSILMNSANVVFRRVVKHFDDCMTVPNIRRIYDWNMQFNERDDIKGDFEVHARGSSVLLVRELQAQNLMAMISTFAGHPVLGPLGKWANAFRKLCEAHMIHSDELVKSDDEIREDQDRARKEAELAAQNQGPNESQLLGMKLNHELQNAREQREHDAQMRDLDREAALIKLAQQHNMTLDQLEAKLNIQREKSAADERKLAAEIAVEQDMAARGQANGSGGYISQAAA